MSQTNETKLSAALGKISRGLGKSFQWINVVVLAIMMLVVFADVVGRLVFKKPIDGASSICEILIVYVAYLGIGYGFHTKSHLQMPLLVRKLPSPIRKVWEVVIYVIALALFAILTYASYKYFLPSFQSMERYATVTPLYIWTARIGVTIGCAFATLQLIMEVLLKINENFLQNKPLKGGTAA